MNFVIREPTSVNSAPVSDAVSDRAMRADRPNAPRPLAGLLRLLDLANTDQSPVRQGAT